MSRTRPWAIVPTIGCVFGMLSLACSSEPPTVPVDGELAAARAGGGGGGGKTGSGIKISALDPDTVTTDTIVTIRVLGSGFTAGSQVSWALAGTPTTDVRTTGPVSFVSANELHAPVTVAKEATLASYDVVVTAVGGKKGIGVEKLEVVAKPILLPEPEGTVRSSAADVNDSGAIVGYAYDAADHSYAVRWTQAGEDWTVEVLGPGSANAINDEGYIVRRQYEASTERFDSWIITPSGSQIHFPEAYVHAISNTGTLVGSIGPSGERVQVLWRRLSGTTWAPPYELPAAAGYAARAANGISDRDDLAGHMYVQPDISGLEWAAVWTYAGGGQWNPPALVDAELGGAAFVVNAGRAVAGASWPCATWNPNGCDPSRPAFWPAVGAARQLLADPYYGVYAGGTAFVNDMNNANQIVGWARVPGKGRNTNTHAVLWPFPSAAEPVDLGAAFANWFSEAVAINDAGLAAGYGRDPNGERHAMAWRIP
jgi:hypothetical protein